MVEHLVANEKVAGPIPVSRSQCIMYTYFDLKPLVNTILEAQITPIDT